MKTTQTQCSPKTKYNIIIWNIRIINTSLNLIY